MRNYEANATAAQQRLGNSIGQNVSILIDDLIKQAEHFPDWEDELFSLSSIEEVEESQYRMLADDETDSIRVVPVTSIDQDDKDISPLVVVSQEVFARWVFAKHYPDDLADQDIPPCDFASGDDRDALFEVANLFLGDPSDLTQFLRDVEPKWSTHYNLLDEGEDPSTQSVDVYEYWLVDSYAKAELESVGEKVAEIFNLSVWCRTTTGQTFWYDACMQKLGETWV